MVVVAVRAVHIGGWWHMFADLECADPKIGFETAGVISAALDEGWFTLGLRRTGWRHIQSEPL